MSQFIRGTIRAWGYHIGFNGDLLSCKPAGKLRARPRIEIPVNVLLDYQYRAFPFMGRLDLFINRYHYGQKRPALRKISPLFLISPKKNQLNALLASFDEVLLANLAGDNLGLHHIERSQMEAFYHARKGADWLAGKAGLKIAYTNMDTVPETTTILPLPEQHDLAS